MSVVALVGLSGAGKSTVAPLLAARLGGGWIDLDDAIAREAGTPVPALLRREGEAAFRAREAAALRAVLEARPRPRVLACGGGILSREENRALLAARATVVWLRVPPAVAAERLGRAGASERPLLDGADPPETRLAALEAERGPSFDAAADLRIDTAGRTPSEVAEEIHRALRARGPGWEPSAS